MKIKNLPASERPMEKALKNGVETLSNAEILALILNSGTKEKSAIQVAWDIIGKYPLGISQLRESTFEDLIEVNGIGKGKALRILAVLELGKRISCDLPLKQNKIKSSEDIAELLMEELRFEKKEHFISIALSSSGDIINLEHVSIGELTSTVVHPREAFSKAIRKSAASVIFAHNHPSGDPTPSTHDIRTTERLVKCGQLLGIDVLDHVIIGNGRYISLRACNNDIFGGSD